MVQVRITLALRLVLVLLSLVQVGYGVSPHTHPQAGWRLSGEATGELAEYPAIPTRGSNSSTIIRGTVLVGENIYLAGTVTAVIPTDVAGGRGGGVSKGKLLLMTIRGGNTTSFIAAAEHTSQLLFGDHFLHGFGEATTGRLGYANDSDGEGLFVCGSAVETAGQVPFLARFGMDLRTVRWSRVLKQELRTGLVGECTGLYVHGEAIFFSGNEWNRGDGDQDSFVGRLNTITGRTEVYERFGTPRNDAFNDLGMMMDDLLIVGGCTQGDPDGPGPLTADDTNPHDCWGLTLLYNSTTLELVTMSFFSDIDALSSITAIDGYGSTQYFTGYAIPPTRVVMLIFGYQPYDPFTRLYTSRVAISIQPVTSDASIKRAAVGAAIHVDETSVYITGRTNGLLDSSSWGFVGDEETFLLMMERGGTNFRWVRYGSKEGQSQPSTLACDADQCVVAGTYRHSSNNGTLFDLMRTPLCGNGSHIEPYVAGQLVSWSTCYYCQAGEYQDVAGYDSCKVAPAGTYVPAEGFRLPIPAPLGYYVPSNKSSNATIAPAGSFVASIQSVAYELCPPGSYNPDEGASECAQLCPPGFASASVGATANTTCTICPAGSYAATAGSSQCTLCGRGSYQPSIGSTVCLMCPTGKYLNETGAVNATQCIDAPVGHYVSRNASALPTPCPKGEYQNATGQTFCYQCPPGYEANSTGLTGCSTCPPGTSSATWGSGECGACSRGEKQALWGQTACDVCIENTYAQSVRSLSCTSCPENSVSPKFSQHVSACYCLPGYYGSPQHGRPCKACPAQTSCGAGDQYPRVKLGMWASTDAPETLLSCVPIKACPGGAPRDLPDLVVNATASSVGIRPDLQLKSMSAGLVPAAGDGSRIALSTTSTSVYTSSCLDGYEGEACSVCVDGFYRTKGKCEQCSTSTIPTWVIYIGMVLAALVGAASFLVLGLWKGSAIVVYRKHRQVLLDRVSHEINLTDAEKEAIMEFCRAHVTPEHEGASTKAGRGSSAKEINDAYDDGSEAEDAFLLAGEGGVPPIEREISIDGTSVDEIEGQPAPTGNKEKPGLLSRARAPFRAVRSSLNAVAHRLRIRYNKIDRKVVFERENRPTFSRLMAVASKAIKFAQLYSVLLNINVTWPDTLKSIGSALQIISLDINDIISVQCATDTSAEDVYRDRYLLRVFLPLGFIILNGVYALGGNLIGNVSRILRFRKLARAPKDAPAWKTGVAWVARALVMGEDSLIASVDHFIFLTMLVAIVAYITIHAAVMEIWTCTHRSGGRYFLVAEPTIQCFVDGGVWIQLVPVSVICFFLLSLGIPVILVLLLFTKHPKRHQHAVATRYSFLWNSYSDDMFAWEIVVTAFKVLLVLALPLSVSSAGDQLTFMLFLCVIFFILHLFYLPHRVPSDNYMEALLMCSVVVLTIAGIIFDLQSQSDSTTGMSAEGEVMLEYLLLCFIVFVVGYFVYTALGGQVLRLRVLAYWNKVFRGGNMTLSVYNFVLSLVAWQEGGESIQETPGGSEVVQYSDGILLMGYESFGSTLYIPHHYSTIWPHCAVRIARGCKKFMSALRNGARRRIEPEEVTLIGLPGESPRHFGIFLLRMLARRSNGLAIGMIHFIDAAGVRCEINLLTLVVRPLTHSGKSALKGASRPLVSIVCGDAADYTAPPNCVAVMRMLDAENVGAEEFRYLSAQAAAVHLGLPPAGGHLVLAMPGWNPRELGEFGERMADLPDAAFSAARSIILAGAYPGRLGNHTTDMRDELESHGALMAPGRVLAAIRDARDPSLGRSLLVHLMTSCPGGCVFVNVSQDEVPPPGKLGRGPLAPSLCVGSEQLLQFATANISTEWRAVVRVMARIREDDEYFVTLGYQRQMMHAVVAFLVSNGCVFIAGRESGLVEMLSNAGPASSQGFPREASRRQMRMMRNTKTLSGSSRMGTEGPSKPGTTEVALPMMDRQVLHLDENHRLFRLGDLPSRLAASSFYYIRRCTGLPHHTLGHWESCRTDGLVGFFTRVDAFRVTIFCVKTYDADTYARSTVARDIRAVIRYVLDNDEMLWPQASVDGSDQSRGWWALLKAAIRRRRDGEVNAPIPLNSRSLSSAASVDEPMRTLPKDPQLLSPVTFLGRDLVRRAMEMRTSAGADQVGVNAPQRPPKLVSPELASDVEPTINGRPLRVVLLNVIAKDTLSSSSLPADLPSINVSTSRPQETLAENGATVTSRIRVRVTQVALGVDAESRVQGDWTGQRPHLASDASSEGADAGFGRRSGSPERRQLMTLKQLSTVGHGLREGLPLSEEQALNKVLDKIFSTLCDDYARRAASKYRKPAEGFLEKARGLAKRYLNPRERNAELRRWITVLARRPEIGSDTESEMLEEVSERYKCDVETGGAEIPPAVVAMSSDSTSSI